MENLAALISFVVVFGFGGLFYMALPAIDPALAVTGVNANKKVRELNRRNIYLEAHYKAPSIPTTHK